jgi:hypothetical protein
MSNFVDLATNLFTLNGSPLKLPKESMRHIYPIYNDTASASLFKFGRQTHKSTTVSNKLTLPTIKYPSYHALYVAPTGNQVSVFSTDKLDGTIKGSSIIQKYYVNPRTKNQITYKEFTNLSKIYLRSAYHSADAIRGISSDMVCIDEVQDIVSDHIPVIEQCMSHSLAKWEDMTASGYKIPMHLFNSRIYAGTPKTVENTLEVYWEKSTQNEWIISCSHCKKYNYIDEENIGPTCLICRKCGKPIYYEHGQWVKMNPSGILSGYRLPQIVLNWINNRNNPKAWKINVINTRETYSTEKFYNEVLALPYANAKNPITIQDLLAVCKPEITYLKYKDKSIEGLPVFAGIDWGKGDCANGTSYTVLCVGTVIRGRFRIIFMKKYTGKMSDPLLQLNDILQYVSRYNCRLTLADSGDGRTSNAEMVKALGPMRFGEVFEHGTIKDKLRWDKKQGMYIINRSRMMTDLFMEIKRNQVDFPDMEKHFNEYKSDFLNIYTEYSEQTRMSKYDHTGPDDAFHAYMFCRLAAMIVRGEMNQYLTGGASDHNSGEIYETLS